MMFTYLHKKFLQNCAYGALESIYLFIPKVQPSLNFKFYSKNVQYDIPEPKRDYVVSLFENYGFTEDQISSLIIKKPVLLSYHPTKTIQPKLDFFKSIGASPSDLESILNVDPFVFKRNLENQIIPCYQYLKSVLHTNENVVASIKRSTWLLKQDLRKYLAPNIAVLLECGVPCDRIPKLLKTRPRALIQSPEKFVEIVEEIKKMGFDPAKSAFGMAIHGLVGYSKLNWERKKEIYRKWGWSDEEILAAFKKAPTCMATSEKKIETAMDFLINKMGWDSSEVAESPYAIMHSLENWTVPRCLVIQFLSSKGLIKEKRLKKVIHIQNKRFLKMFVDPYCAKFPELLSIYQPKVVSPESD